MRLVATTALLSALALPLAGCAGASSADPRSASDSAPAGSAAAPAARLSAASTPKVTKLLVVVEENHSLSQMKKGMPYTFGLAKQYGYATAYHAITHPSLPNYIAIASGKTYGVTDDDGPAAHPLGGTSVFGQAIAHHKTAATYAQSMPGSCAQANSGNYAVRHNPWTYFAGERAACRVHDHKFARLATDVDEGHLPRVGLVIPDLQHDAHDGTLKAADAWFRSMMAKVYDGPDWKSGHLAVVLTADEDDRNHGNRVLTVMIHPSQHHHVVTKRLTHYSLTRLYDEVAHLKFLNGARRAPSMAKAFGLPVS